MLSTHLLLECRLQVRQVDQVDIMASKVKMAEEEYMSDTDMTEEDTTVGEEEKIMVEEEIIKPAEDEAKTEATLITDPLMETHLAHEIDKHEQEHGVSRYKWMFLILINLGLVAFLFSYAFMGGAVFVALEHNHEMSQYREFQKAREDLKDGIGNLTGCKETKDMIDLKHLEGILEQFENRMKKLVCDANVDTTGQSQWTFWSAVFFSATVISTIGKH